MSQVRILSPRPLNTNHSHRMDTFTQDEISFLLDIVHTYYEKDDTLEPLIEKLWKMESLLDIRTDKAWGGAE